MRRFFRTFNGYMTKEESPKSYRLSDGILRYSMDIPGTQIIHSETKPYNIRCGQFGDRYHARHLANEEDWRARMLEAIDFMEEEGYDEIGCYTFCDCGGSDQICTSIRCENRPNAKTMIPEERYGNEGELDTAAIFLASKASSYVNGVNLPVDGGYTAM